MLGAEGVLGALGGLDGALGADGADGAVEGAEGAGEAFALTSVLDDCAFALSRPAFEEVARLLSAACVPDAAATPLFEALDPPRLECPDPLPASQPVF